MPLSMTSVRSPRRSSPRASACATFRRPRHPRQPDCRRRRIHPFRPFRPHRIPAQGAIDLTVTFSAPEPATVPPSCRRHRHPAHRHRCPSLTCLTDSGPPPSSLTYARFRERRPRRFGRSPRHLRNGPCRHPHRPCRSVERLASRSSPRPPDRISAAAVRRLLRRLQPRRHRRAPGTRHPGTRTFPLAGTAIDPRCPRRDHRKPARGRRRSRARSSSATTPAQTTARQPPPYVLGIGLPSRPPTLRSPPPMARARHLPHCARRRTALPFQTGTTAASHLHRATRAFSAQQSVTIAPPPPPCPRPKPSRARFDRNPGGELDNSTLGPLAFAFSTRPASRSPPSAASATVDFANTSPLPISAASSSARCLPITGDASQIAACDVTLGNSIGTPFSTSQLQWIARVRR